LPERTANVRTSCFPCHQSFLSTHRSFPISTLHQPYCIDRRTLHIQYPEKNTPKSATMHGEVLHHLARRGYQAMSTTESRETIVAEIDPVEMIPVVLTGALFVFILASVRRLEFNKSRHVINTVTDQIHYRRSCR
jgi:hypothetical protein